MTRAWPLRRPSAAVWFGIACTVISWAGLAAYWNTHRLVRSYDSAAESHRSLEKLQQIQAWMEAAESSVDEYVITGIPARLIPYHDAARHVPDELQSMEKLVQKTNPTQFNALQQLERLTLGHLSYLRNVARVRRTRGVAAASSWIATENSGSPRAFTQRLLAELWNSERMDVHTRTVSASKNSDSAKAVLILAALASLGFLIWAFMLWARESRERAHADRERGRMESFLYSIIERIPYIVLVKEARALRVVHANHAAARWLGRSTEELVGANVFDWRTPKEAEEEARQDRQVLAAMKPVDIPEETVTVEGQPRIFHTQKVAIPDPDGQPAYLVTISEDVTEQKRAAHMVELSRDAAVESARLKSEFLRNMTHEFRTPLSVMVGMSSLLEDTELTEDQRHFVKAVRKAGEGLSQLTKNILDFSKIETGSFQLETQEVPLSETVETVLRMYAEQASAKGIELSSALAGDVPPALWGDRARLRQVLTHLIGNAVKFTAKGSITVRVSLAKEDAAQCWIHCRVTDSGLGVDPALRSNLFAAFRQGDGSATRRYGGTGLGLALAQRIIDLMGGEIGFEPAPDAGSTFWITVPFKKEYSNGRAEAVAPRVIIVDENEIVRERFRQQLSLWGLVSAGMPSGESALAFLQKERATGRPLPVLLVSLHLADMDGAEFARTVRSDPKLKDVALVALADVGLDPSAATQLGFSGSATKTPTPLALYEALSPFIAMPRFGAVK
jgi:PAS domain S-box-containing protein